jgi:hypothetical protein
MEEISKKKLLISLENISSSFKFILDSEKTSLINIIFKAARIIYQFSKYFYKVPKEIHSRILQTVRENYKKTINMSNLNK